MEYSPTERIGVHGTGLIIENQLGWIFREQPINDWGIDAHIEIINQQGLPTGRLIAAQIKSGKSFFNEQSDEGFIYRGEKRHLEYWRNHSLPVVLILYDPETKVAYWETIREEAIKYTSKAWKITIPKSKKLSTSSLYELSILAQTNLATSASGDIQSTPINQIVNYLENLQIQLSKLPSYYESGFDFTRIRQRVRVSRHRLTHFEFQVKEQEAEHRSGYFDDENEVRGYIVRGEEMYQRAESGSTIDEWEKLREKLHRGIILGDPGFGKTWLLKHEGLRIAQSQLYQLRDNSIDPDEVMLPIYLRLATIATQLKDSGENILNVIVQIIASSSNLSPKWLLKQLNKGNGILLLDALDEVEVKLRSQLIDALSELAEITPCKILLTSRIVGYQRPFTLKESAEDQELEIVAFDTNQVKSFVDAWFLSNLERGNDLIKILIREPDLRGLARIPILLSFICLLAKEDQPLPTKRVQLYETLLSLLLEGRWRDESLRDQNADRIEAKLLLLEEIAWHFATGTNDKNWHDLLMSSELSKVILNSQYSGILRETALHQNGVLWELSQHDGLLIKAGAATGESERQIPYLFLHRSFHEYLVARYLSRLPIETSMQIVKEHCWYDADWEETIAMLAGCLSNWEPLFDTLLSEGNDVFNRMLILTGRCLSETKPADTPEDIKEAIVQELLELNESPSYSEKKQARRVLIRIGNEEVLTKLTQLYKTSSDDRSSLADDITEIDSKKALAFFREGLQSEDSHARYLAVDALGKINTEESKSLLCEALDDSSLKVRSGAAQLLGDFDNPKVVAAIREELLSSDSTGSWLIIHKISDIGGSVAVNLLIDVLESVNKYARIRVIEGLSEIGSIEAINFLRKVLKHPLTDVRIEAAKQLAQKGDGRALNVLKASLNYKELLSQFEKISADINIEESKFTPVVKFLKRDEDKLKQAFIASELYGGDYAFSFLFDLLNHESIGVRWLSATLLCQICGNQKARELRSVVVAGPQDFDWNKRTLLKYALAIIFNKQGSRDHFKELAKHRIFLTNLSKVISLNSITLIELGTAISNFKDSLESPKNAIYALGYAKTSATTKILIQSLENPSQDFRKNIAETLIRIDSKEAIDGLIQCLNDESINVRIKASEGLGKTFGENAPEDIFLVLSQALTEKNIKIRESAVRTLKEINNEKAKEILQKALDDPIQNIRVDAAQALGAAGGKKAIAILETELLQREWPWYRNMFAAETLSKIGNKQAVRALLKGLSSHRGGYVNAALYLKNCSQGPMAIEIWNHILNIWPRYNTQKKEILYNLLSEIAPEVCRQSKEEWINLRRRFMNTKNPPSGFVKKSVLVLLVITLRIILYIPLKLFKKKNN